MAFADGGLVSGSLRRLSLGQWFASLVKDWQTNKLLISKHSPPVILAHFISDTRSRKSAKPQVIKIAC